MPSSAGKRRPNINRERVKKLFENRCKICGKSDKEVRLEIAHLKAFSKGGSLVVPLCPNCHTRFDGGVLTSRELKKLGLTQKEYKRYLPKKRGSSKVDEKYYYLWGDGKKQYKSEETLPASACDPGKHDWEQSFSFGMQYCTKCKAKRKAR